MRELLYHRCQTYEDRPWVWYEFRSMSRHFFMTSAHAPWNVDLSPVHRLSSHRTRRKDLHAAAPVRPLRYRSATRCGELPDPVHPFQQALVAKSSGRRTDTPVRPDMGIIDTTPSRECSRKTPSLPNLSHVSLGHSLSASPAPCGTSGSAFAGLLPQPSALGPHSGKSTLGTWERGTSRRFAQECPE